MSKEDNAPSSEDETSNDQAEDIVSSQDQPVQDDVEKKEDIPLKVRREKVITPQSFIDFLRYYGSLETIVFLDANKGKAFSILNYAARAVVKEDEEENGNDEEEDYLTTLKIMPPPKFHCNWQLVYELEYTSDWLQLESITKQTFSARDGALALLQLRDHFIEPEENYEDSLSFRDTEMREILPQLLGLKALPAKDEVMAELIMSNAVHDSNLLINFALPVHAGCPAQEALVLIFNEGGEMRFDLLNRKQALIASTKTGISKIRNNLSDTFPVFDTDLEKFDW
ncbi:MAG: hypothetical protein COA85_06370 [Robiginitomaculum sp.]|nr:MAG: hypothetical protein COA85_06370 [Robiginitomaculum sp.]